MIKWLKKDKGVEKKEKLQEMEREEKYTELINGFRGVFANAKGLNNARNYISGLQSSTERKNGWQLSETTGEKLSV